MNHSLSHCDNNVIVLFEVTVRGNNTDMKPVQNYKGSMFYIISHGCMLLTLSVSEVEN